MHLIQLTLQNFRNYNTCTVEFNKHGNILFGANGQGKTNIIEAIYYLSVFRSFRRMDDLFALLDRARISAFLQTLRQYGQFFITANTGTQPEAFFAEAGIRKTDYSQFSITEGVISNR